ncbi:MAG: hypothetical protein Tsb0017_25200 [Geothermobacteraceae bacterium]
MTREELRELSRAIDNLMNLNRTDDGRELLDKALQESSDDPAYNLFFQAEIQGYFEPDSVK